jgi:meiotic recombination protein REC8, fungi type
MQPAQDFPSGSQRSNLFPWDHAGVSSSVSGAVFAARGSDHISLGRADSRLRGSSFGRDSIAPIPESPASFRLNASHRDSAFEFNGMSRHLVDVPRSNCRLPVPAEELVGDDSQMSHASAMTLERNSFNFLE